ncbi:MAG: hypothetical protein U0176_04445 [Bacteroidia bacterium]
MGTPLRENENFVFFRKASFTGGKVAGVTNVDAAVIGTSKFIFVLPKKEMTSILVAHKIRTFNMGEGVSVEQGAANMLADPQMTVEQLEEDLKELLGADNHDRVIEISQLSHFRVHMLWILSQARMNHKAGGATKVLSVRGDGGMKRFKAFYDPKS